MKKLFPLLVLFVAFATSTAAQSVAINNDATPPDPSAILDIKSLDKGLLIPRTTTAAVVNPVTGLLIYDTGTNTFQFYNGTSWVELSTGTATNYWTQTGNNLHNNNTGNVGVGINTAFEKLQVDGNFKIGNAQWVTSANDRFLKIGDGNFVTIGETGQDDRMTLTGRNFIFMSSLGSYPGNIGIGLTTPTSPLSFAQVLGDKVNLWNTDATHNYGLGVQGGLLQVHSNDNTSAIAFGNGSSTAFNETVRFTGAGKVGIGTNAPSSMLEIKPAAGTADIELTGASAGNAVLRLNPTVVGANADIQFKNSGTINWDMGVLGNNRFAIKHAPSNNVIMDIDDVTRHIGFFTNDFTEDINIAGNLATNGGVISKGAVGGFQFRDRTLNNYSGWNWYADNGKANLYRYNSGGDVLTVDASGNLGIGTSTPSVKLEVNGQMKITGGTPGIGKVLTSDASGLATWSAQAYGNLERFRFYYNGAIFVPATLHEEFDLQSTEYNYSANIVFNAAANTITFNKAGLYHIEVTGSVASNTDKSFTAYLFLNSLLKPDYYQNMPATGGSPNYRASINHSFEMYFTVGTVLSFRNLYGSAGTVQDGYITGHLISE